MKKYVYLLAAVILMAVMAAGCGRNNNNDDDYNYGSNGYTTNAATPEMSAATQQRLQERGSAAADPSAFVLGLTQELTGALFGNLSELNNLYADAGPLAIFNELMGNGNGNGNMASHALASLSLNAPAAQVNRWIAEFPELADFADVLNMVVNSGIEMEILSSVGDDLSIALQFAWTLNNVRLLTFEALLLDGRLYLAVPELYDHHIVIDLEEMFGISMDYIMYELSYIMASDGFEDEIFAVLDDILDVIARNEAGLAAAFDNVLAAALAQLPNITTTNNVSVIVDSRPVVYNEVTISFTERELIDAAQAALEALIDSDVVIDVFVDVFNLFADMDPWMDTITAQDVRSLLNEGVEELNSVPALSPHVYVFRIFLNPTTNAVTGMEFDLGIGIILRGFFDFSHGFEFLFHQEGIMTLKIHGTLQGSSNNFSGDLWFEFTERHWDWMTGADWTDTFAGRLATFEVRYNATDDYYIRIATQLGDIFALVGENPHDLMPALFAEYLNNAEISITMEASGNTASFVFEIREPVADLSIRFEVALEEVYEANIAAPTMTLDFNDIDVLLSRDLLQILGNVFEVIEQIEAMGFDASIVDMLLAEIF
ncbi:MAG: hypothetical protein FWC71_10895 [Defluviitaleaceae bacterium]|nr:hypothetical protein [Defluviitaleaceae bacterium]